MSTRRLFLLLEIPEQIRRQFKVAVGRENLSGEEKLWIEVAARATLDAIGYTGLNEVGPHNKAVQEARLWFKFSGEAQDIFDIAEIDLKKIRKYVLSQSGQYIEV